MTQYRHGMTANDWKAKDPYFRILYRAAISKGTVCYTGSRHNDSKSGECPRCFGELASVNTIGVCGNCIREIKSSIRGSK